MKGSSRRGTRMRFIVVTCIIIEAVREAVVDSDPGF